MIDKFEIAHREWLKEQFVKYGNYPDDSENASFGYNWHSENVCKPKLEHQAKVYNQHLLKLEAEVADYRAIRSFKVNK